MRDIIGGLVLLVLAGGYYLQSLRIPKSTLNDTYGAHGVPQIFAICLGALGVLLATKALLALIHSRSEPGLVVVSADGTMPDASAAEEKQPSLSYAILRMLGMLAVGVAYILLLPWIGYPLAVGLMVGAVVLYQGGAARIGLLLTMIGASVGFWAIFVKLLGVPLPAGIWAN